MQRQLLFAAAVLIPFAVMGTANVPVYWAACLLFGAVVVAWWLDRRQRKAAIGQTARALLECYNAYALLMAATHADRLYEAGERRRAAVWYRVVVAIERLQAKAPAEGDKVH